MPSSFVASITAAIRTEPKGARRARFAKAACDRCALRDRCVQPAGGFKAVLLAPSIVSDRYVQLTPVWTSGPTLDDKTHLGLERTTQTVELDVR